MKLTREHVALVIYEELKECEAIKDSPGPHPFGRYSIRDLHIAAITELWDLAQLLGVSKRLHELNEDRPA